MAKNHKMAQGTGSAGVGKAAKPAAQDIAAQLDLKPGQSIELLKALHILTRDGKLNQDSRRKLKQVYHLYQFIEPILQELGQGGQPLTLADHGAGKSYLGFILYDLYFKAQAQGHIYGIETRAPLVEASQKLAAELGFERMHFLNMSVAESTRADAMPERFDVITALHACDTATDDAIAFGLEKKAKAMVLVPCCQAEVAACLRQTKAMSLSRTLWPSCGATPSTREMGSQITNVLRCLYLEASGYQVTVTELVGWEHSMKNELIVARYTGHKKRSAAERLQQLLTEFGLESCAARFKVGCPETQRRSKCSFYIQSPSVLGIYLILKNKAL